MTLSLFTPQHRRAIRFDSFTSACGAFRILHPQSGVIGCATPTGIYSFRTPPHLRPLSSTGITRRLQYYGPLRQPVSPVCPSRGTGWRAHATDRASRVATSSIFHTCQHHYPGGSRSVRVSLASRPTIGLPLDPGESAPALRFSRPARRSLAFRPAWSLSCSCSPST